MSGKAPTAELADDAGRPGWEPHLDRGLVARLGRRPTVIPCTLGDRIWRRVEYFMAQAGALTRSLLDRGMSVARDGSDAPIVHVRWREIPEPPGAGVPDVSPAQTVSAQPATAVVKAEATKTLVAPEATGHARAEPARSPSSPLAAAWPRLPVAPSATDLSAVASAEMAPDATASTRRLDHGRGGLAAVASATGRASAALDFAEDGKPVELMMPPGRRRARRGVPVHPAAAVDAGGMSADATVDVHSGPGASPAAERMVELHVPAVRRSGSAAVVAEEFPQHGQARLAPAIDGWPERSVAETAPVAAATRESPGKAQGGIASVVPPEDGRVVVVAATSVDWATSDVASPSANTQGNNTATGPRTVSGAARVLSPRALADAAIDRQQTVAPALVDRVAGPGPLHHSPADREGAPRLALPHVGHGRLPSSGHDPDAPLDASQTGSQRAGERMPTGVPVQEPLRVPTLSTSTQVTREDVSPRTAWPAPIDIDRLALQVERRITKRLAVDAERRGGWS